jgi:hypothetical protein
MTGDRRRAARSLAASPALFAKALLPGRHPDFYLEARVTAAPGTRLAGVYFNDGDYFRNLIPYQVALDFRTGELIFGHKYRGANEERIAGIWADVTAGREVKLQLMVQSTTVEGFVDDRFSFASRAYDAPSQGRIGFFVENGGRTVRDVKIMPLS